MIVVNTETVPGREVGQILGLVQGNTVRAKNVGRDIAAGFKNMVGGELKGYTQLLVESRRQSVERMIAQGNELGADAIVNVRFTTSAVTNGAAELYAYGTAVKLSSAAAPISDPSSVSATTPASVSESASNSDPSVGA